MKDLVGKVKLLKPFNVDGIRVEKDRYFDNAYVVDLPLDSEPNHVWQYIFELKWKSSRHLWDRKLFVVGDRLRLVTGAGEFSDKLDWIEQIINETNKAFGEYVRAVQLEEDRRVKEEISRPRVWEEKARLEMIKEVLRKKFS